MIVVADLPPASSTTAGQVMQRNGEQETQRVGLTEPTEGRERLSTVQAVERKRTAALVEEVERGLSYEQVQNEGVLEPSRRARRRGPAAVDSADGEASRLRSALARQMSQRARNLISHLGDPSFATSLELLKRDLSRCHDRLANRPSEAHFLSLVTLIESVFAQTKLKDYTPSQLEQVLAAIEVAYRQPKITFEDYERIRKDFLRHGIETRPIFDLDVLSMDELADGEEPEEDDQASPVS